MMYNKHVTHLDERDFFLQLEMQLGFSPAWVSFSAHCVVDMHDGAQGEESELWVNKIRHLIHCFGVTSVLTVNCLIR